MGLLWRKYPRRKPSLKRPRRRFLSAWQGMAWGECKPRFQKFYRKTSDQLGVNWHSIPWGPGLYLSSLKWVLGGLWKRLVE